jgi:pimeloyl-ACP methyl ester carboxylesterase
MATLVLLPGLDGTGDLFRPLIASLPSNIKTIVVRYPAAGALDYVALETIARASIPKDEPYFLLGESFSGPIAISLAASANDQLKGLILACTFVRNPRPMLVGIGFLIPWLHISHATIGLLSKLLMNGFHDKRLRKELAKVSAKVSPAAYQARLKAVLAVDVSQKLSKVKAPVLYLRAINDLLIPPSAAAIIKDLAPQTEITEIKAPHLLQQVAAKEAALKLQTFIGAKG